MTVAIVRMARRRSAIVLPRAAIPRAKEKG